jgi:hypothetical protein
MMPIAPRVIFPIFRSIHSHSWVSILDEMLGASAELLQGLRLTNGERMSIEQKTVTIAAHEIVGFIVDTGKAAADRHQGELALSTKVCQVMAPEASDDVADAPKPWEDLSAGAKGLNLPMSAELYAKMVWVCDNVPRMSLQKIAKQGAEELCDRLIAQYYKP